MNLLSTDVRPLVDDYLGRLRNSLQDLPGETQSYLLSYAQAQIELEAELEPAITEPAEIVKTVLHRLGDPERYAQRLRATLPQTPEASPESAVQTETTDGTAASLLSPCRTCRQMVSKEAWACPRCGAPYPVLAGFVRRATGYEWKSRATLFGWPLVHVAFGRDKNGKLRVAKGVIAIGQFGIGAITIAQFGIGFLFGLGQFMLSPLALGQFAIGLVAIGQFGIGLLFGLGQFATGITAIGQFKGILPRL